MGNEKRKANLWTAVIVVIAVIFLFSQCGGGDDTSSETGKTETQTTEKTSGGGETGETPKELTYETGKLCTKKQCSFALLSGDEEHLEIKIKNNSKHDYSFDVHSMAINGVMTNCNIYTADTGVPSKKKGVLDVSFDDDWLENVENIEYIDMIIWAYDDAKSYKGFDTGILRIKTNYYQGDAKFKPGAQCKKKSGLWISKESMDTEKLVFSVVNQNKYYVNIDFQNSSVNGWGLDDDYLFDVLDVCIYPGAKTTLEVDLSDFTEGKKIKKVNNMEFSLKVRKKGDYFHQKDTGKIKFQ